MRVNLLRNVNVTAISLVGKGANRKRYFLRKSGEVGEGGEPDAELPRPTQRLVKAADWSAVYCVVAEPGWQEDPGLGAPEPDVPDLWADEGEIRKAAHAFAKNGGLINAMHASLEPYGEMVENFLAPVDFTVMGPEGPEAIKKGSWVVAIEPNEVGRAAIEAGEFTGVSIEGSALREPVEKGAPDWLAADDATLERAALAKGLELSDSLPPGVTVIANLSVQPAEASLRYWRRWCEGRDWIANDGEPPHDLAKRAVIFKDAVLVPDKPGANNWIDRTGTGDLPKFLANLAGDLITEKGKSVGNAIQMAWGIVRNWAHGAGHVSAATRAKAVAAVAEMNAKLAQAHAQHAVGKGEVELGFDASAPTGGRVGRRMKDFLRKLGQRVGMTPEDLAELDEVEKGTSRTFGAIMAERDLEDELPDAFDALRSAIWNAFYPPYPGEGEVNPIALIGQSLDEFKAWALDVLDGDGAVAKVAEQIEQASADAELIDAASVAVADRAAAMASALGVAKGEGDDVSRSTVTAILTDPAAWLAENGGDDVAKAVATTDASWDGSASRFTDAEYKRSCLIVGKTKADSHLPIREPSGAINVNALSAAKGALSGARGGLKDVTAAQIATAKKKLAAAYKAAGKDVPSDLKKFATFASDEDLGTVDSEMGWTDEEREQIDGLKKAVEELPTAVSEAIAAAINKNAGNGDTPPATDPPAGDPPAGDPPAGDPPAGDPPPAAADAVTKADFEELREMVVKLGEGRSTQPKLSDEELAKAADEVQKAFEENDLPPALVGLHANPVR